MSQPKLGLWQRFRYWRFKRMCERECQRQSTFGGLFLKKGELVEAVSVEGYVWKLYDGREVTAQDVQDAESSKWLYRIHC